jgi:hypothetical protein
MFEKNLIGRKIRLIGCKYTQIRNGNYSSAYMREIDITGIMRGFEIGDNGVRYIIDQTILFVSDNDSHTIDLIEQKPIDDTATGPYR